MTFIQSICISYNCLHPHALTCTYYVIQFICYSSAIGISLINWLHIKSSRRIDRTEDETYKNKYVNLLIRISRWRNGVNESISIELEWTMVERLSDNEKKRQQQQRQQKQQKPIVISKKNDFQLFCAFYLRPLPVSTNHIKVTL